MRKNINYISMIILILLSLIFFNSLGHSQQPDSVIGYYYRGTGLSAEELEIRPDSTFQYRYYVDLGGWSSPATGKWTMDFDTLHLRSFILPEILLVREEYVPGDSLIIYLLDATANPLGYCYPDVKISVNSLEPRSNPYFHFVPSTKTAGVTP